MHITAADRFELFFHSRFYAGVPGRGEVEVDLIQLAASRIPAAKYHSNAHTALVGQVGFKNM